MKRAALALWLAACSPLPRTTVSDETSAPPDAAAGGVLEPGAFAPAGLPTVAPGASQPPVRPTAALEPVRVRFVRVAATRGEDGYGHSVVATRPIAIDLEADHGWHAGGLTTTLTVGSLRFHDMGYPSITTMRFLVADEGALPRDAEVALEVGSALRRRVLATSLTGAR
jgi:hypothetical protein